MKQKNHDYTYHSETISMCPECMQTVQSKIIIKDGSVYLLKNCKKHGHMLHLLEEDSKYFLNQSKYDKPGTICKTQTKFNKGCPFDCGLCTEHEQHTCIGLIEVTNKCNLKCPVCYANSGTGTNLSLGKIEEMMDFYQDTEYGNAEILQISGGEPTMHPDIIKIIDMAMEKKFKHVMLNSNGLRIATDKEFVKELAKFTKGFEVYLQFDGFEESTYTHFRGRHLLDIKKQAIDNLTEAGVLITLVTTVEKDVNDKELGAIIKIGLDNSSIRGVNFQPVSLVGRLPDSVNHLERITKTGVLKLIEKQTKGMVLMDDFLPLPCHPERIAFTYLYRGEEGFKPITRGINTEKYVPIIKNTFSFVPEDFLKDAVKELVKPKKVCTSPMSCNCFDIFKDLKPLIPKKYLLKSKEEQRKHLDENTFRISVSSFVDAYNFDIQSMRKECVHIITPDLRKMPFSSYNMIYREKEMNND